MYCKKNKFCKVRVDFDIHNRDGSEIKEDIRSSIQYLNMNELEIQKDILRNETQVNSVLLTNIVQTTKGSF